MIEAAFYTPSAAGTKFTEKRQSIMNYLKFILVLSICLTCLSEYAQGSAVVLQYHHVAENTPAVTSISPADFTAHMEYLDKNGFKVLPLDEIINSLQNDVMLPDRTVAITFDDAYKNIYTSAFPLLQRLDFPFSIFVATDLVGTNSKLYLNWQQLTEMAQHGALIVNHTLSHLHLLRLLPGEASGHWLARIENEITQAQKVIETHLGRGPKIFAYPYGEYNDDILSLVQSLGYLGFGQQSGAMGAHSNFLALPRFPMAGIYTGMDAFKTKINTLPLPIEPIHVESLVSSDQLQPSITLKFTEGKWRTSELNCFGPGGKMVLEKLGPKSFLAMPAGELPIGRSRYNCTMPSHQAGRYFWYSQPWIRKNDDGSWYAEP